METLLIDLILNISDFLKDNEKIELAITSKTMDKLKHKFIYRSTKDITLIEKLPYFDNFERVMVSNAKHILPKYVKRIYFFAHDTDNIPPFITHLIFDDVFDQSIKGKIPTSVIHLRLGHRFNRPIKDCIPSSATELYFGAYFNQPIKDCIPSSVTKLYFCNSFNQPIKGCIPPFVTHLDFGWDFNHSIKGCIPLTIIRLNFGEYFNRSIDGCLPFSGKLHI